MRPPGRSRQHPASPVATVLGACVALLVVTTGCSKPAPRVCNLIGCMQGLHLELGAGGRSVAEVRICVDDLCETPQVQRVTGTITGDWVDAAMPTTDHHRGATAAVTVDLFDRAGRAIRSMHGTFDVRTIEPNGPRCGTCYQIRLGVDAAGKLEPR